MRRQDKFTTESTISKVKVLPELGLRAFNIDLVLIRQVKSLLLFGKATNSKRAIPKVSESLFSGHQTKIPRSSNLIRHRWRSATSCLLGAPLFLTNSKKVLKNQSQHVSLSFWSDRKDEHEDFIKESLNNVSLDDSATPDFTMKILKKTFGFFISEMKLITPESL